MDHDQAKLDFLQELANIGSGHAAAALSEMLGSKKLTLAVPEAQLVSFDQLFAFIGSPEDLVAGIYIGVTGDVGGHMAFILPEKSAAALTRLLLPVEEVDGLDEMACSALSEVGNIMITSYLNALSTMTNLVLAPTVPGIAVDMAGAVWQSILVGAQVADAVTLIRTSFHGEDVELEGYIMFLPNEEDYPKIAQAVGMEVGNG